MNGGEGGCNIDVMLDNGSNDEVVDGIDDVLDGGGGGGGDMNKSSSLPSSSSGGGKKSSSGE